MEKKCAKDFFARGDIVREGVRLDATGQDGSKSRPRPAHCHSRKRRGDSRVHDGRLAAAVACLQSVVDVEALELLAGRATRVSETRGGHGTMLG